MLGYYQNAEERVFIDRRYDIFNMDDLLDNEKENEKTRQLYVELDVFNYKGLKGAEIIEALRNIPGVTSVNIT